MMLNTRFQLNQVRPLMQTCLISALVSSTISCASTSSSRGITRTPSPITPVVEDQSEVIAQTQKTDATVQPVRDVAMEQPTERVEQKPTPVVDNTQHTTPGAPSQQAQTTTPQTKTPERELTPEEIAARNQQMEELKQAIMQRYNQLRQEAGVPENETVVQEAGAPEDEAVSQEAQQDDTTRLQTTLETTAPETEEERQYLAQQENQLYSEITGLIIDETLTPFGSRFYQNFFITWEAPAVHVDYNIYINEQFSPNWGTRITVRVDDYFIWQQRLQPRSTVIDEAVEQAKGAAYQFLLNYEDFQQQLGGSDMAGTGI